MTHNLKPLDHAAMGQKQAQVSESNYYGKTFGYINWVHGETQYTKQILEEKHQILYFCTLAMSLAVARDHLSSIRSIGRQHFFQDKEAF